MITPKCCGEVVKNQVYGDEFYFCRGCKKEVDTYEISNISFGEVTAYQPFVINPALSTLRLPTAVPAQPSYMSHGHELDIHTNVCKHCVMGVKDINYALNNNITVPSCPVAPGTPRQ